MTTIYNPIPVNALTFASDTDSYGSVPTKFDAALYRPMAGPVGNALKLTIHLRINLRPTTPRPIPFQLDWGGRPFLTSPWHATAWQLFLSQAATQADMWNRKFWLLPPTAPAIFDEFDRTFDTFPGQVFRPNVACELRVDFQPTTDAHRTIDVVNLNTAALTGVPQDSGTFRSHALLYDSLDGFPTYMTFAPGKQVLHYTIAHEIGHAIGLDHIGRLLKTRLCDLALAAERVGVDRALPLTTGGSASPYCYGYSEDVKVAGNVMGFGSNFSVENARPWLWVMQKMYPGGLWRGVRDDPGPGTWIRT
jgi:hypothetical protein